jgi:hypothetical protein
MGSKVALVLSVLITGVSLLLFQNCGKSLPPEAENTTQNSNGGGPAPSPGPAPAPAPAPAPKPFMFQNLWKPLTAANPPPALFGHTAVYTGTKVIIWGGNTNLSTLAPAAGYMLDVAANTWTFFTGMGAPLARSRHTAVWTGNSMIIWGGTTNGGANVTVNDGAIYNGQTGVWTLIPSGGPSPRSSHVAVWTGTEMIVWGGYDNNGAGLGDGAIYNPANGTWRAMSTTGALSPRKHAMAVWTGTKMLVWGGANGAGTAFNGDGAYYDPANNTWTPLTQSTPPPARQWCSADSAPANNLMFIFGGHSGAALQLGFSLDYTTGAWSQTNTTGAPSARYGHTQTMTSQGMVIWGGTDGTNTFGNGAIYY